jgi:hypothetical protein
MALSVVSIRGGGWYRKILHPSIKKSHQQRRQQARVHPHPTPTVILIVFL